MIDPPPCDPSPQPGTPEPPLLGNNSRPLLGAGRRSYVAADLGAESGRVFRGDFDGSRLAIRELARFPNSPVEDNGRSYWDARGLLAQVVAAVRNAISAGDEIGSLGIDAWGVDYGLIDAGGELLGLPRQYRDTVDNASADRVLSAFPPDELYRITGAQRMPINSLFQLAARGGELRQADARGMLLIPDLLNYWLTGERCAEETIASTTQLIDIATNTWSTDLTNYLDTPADFFAPVVSAGTMLGQIGDRAAACLALPAELAICTVASHDTAAAVVGTPLRRSRGAFISSGTWSVVGIERTTPIMTAEACRLNFGNERGFRDTTRFVRNVMGLWLLQECRRAWRMQPGPSAYASLIESAVAEPTGGPIIDPDWEGLATSADMPKTIYDAWVATGQSGPSTRGAIVRCILESLACKYRLRVDELEMLSGETIETIHLVGGGTRNKLLCQLTADVCGREVVAGPTEAAALGNILVQMSSRGELGSLDEIREVSTRSVTVERYEPQAGGDGAALYARFLEVSKAQPHLELSRTLEPRRSPV